MVRLLLILFLLGSCALQSRKDQNKLREHFVKQEFVQAEKYLESSSLKSEDNQLLYLMDKGTLAFYQKRYHKAAKIFVEANELVDQLYTKSVRKMIASSIINDNSQVFYGSLFERSMLYYYQAMSFYRLAETGFYYQEKQVDGKIQLIKTELSDAQIQTNTNRVRSTLIAWNSFYQEMKRLGAKTFLVDDFSARYFAATMHEVLGTKRDKEIALILYREALNSFQLYAPTYKVFNVNYKEYNGELRDYFDKKISEKELKSKTLTEQYSKTENYLMEKVLDLTKMVRPGQFRKTLKTFALKGYKYSPYNVMFQIEAKTINPTEPEDFTLNLRKAIEEIEDPGKRSLVNNIGVPILTAFALGPLGIGYVSHHGSVSVFHHHRAGEELVKEVGIEFELPSAKANTDDIPNTLVIKQGEQIVSEVAITPVVSFSDISFVNAQERVANSFSKRSARVGTKYVLALLAAYTTYSTMKEQDGGALLAGPVATGQFLVSQKAIKESEKADVRHWTTLPNLMLGGKANLSPGEYKVYLRTQTGETFLNDLKVDKRDREIFTHRVF